MMYQCSYCNTGAMNTAEQYEKHIFGAKHKKKSFQLQAPHSGIEYPQFRYTKDHTYSVTASDCIQESNEFETLQYGLTGESLLRESSTNGYFNAINNSNHNSNNNNNHNNTNGEEEVHHSLTIDDVFIKEGSKIRSADFIINSYFRCNRTAAAAMNELAVAMYWTLEFDQIPTNNQKYGFMVKIDGIDLVSGEGDNKKQAKQNASAEAIKVIRLKLKQRINEFSEHETTQTSSFFNNHRNHNNNNHHYNNTINIARQIDLPADEYCRMTMNKLFEIENMRGNKFAVPRRYAAFIMTDKEDQLARDGFVVAFGAGNGVLKRNKDVEKYPGYHITNFDSLVIAKRSLQCFFYNQLRLIFDKKLPKNTTEKIYFMVGKNGKVRLKDGCRLHLFMSHAPYGDCVESIPKDWVEAEELTRKEMERDRNGNLEPYMYNTYCNSQLLTQPGHIRVWRENNSADNDGGGSWISLVDYRLNKKVAIVEEEFTLMSPTDKLTAWVHLGVHGALLSHLMEPVYLYSVQVAHDYMHEHFSRAILCRVPLEVLVANFSGSMPNYKDPYISRVSKLHEKIQLLNNNSRNDNVTYNWYANPVTDLPEIIDNNSGLVHQESLFKLPDGENDFLCSRLSKVCMLLRLKQLFNMAVDFYALRPELQRTRNIQGIGDAARYQYNLFKNSAIEYRSLKQCFFNLLNDNSYGDWAPNNNRNNFDLLEYYKL